MKPPAVGEVVFSAMFDFGGVWFAQLVRGTLHGRAYEMMGGWWAVRTNVKASKVKEQLKQANQSLIRVPWGEGDAEEGDGSGGAGRRILILSRLDATAGCHPCR